MSDSDLIQRAKELAAAFFAQAAESGDYVGDIDDTEWVVIDGTFNLVSILAALPAVAAPGVRVKPLEWIDFEGEGAKAQAWNEANYMIQLWSDGRYEISASYPGYGTFIHGTDRWYPTLAAAKAAAQADYEARIIAALDTPAPAPIDELVEALQCARDYVHDASIGTLRYRGRESISGMACDDLVMIDAVLAKIGGAA